MLTWFTTRMEAAPADRLDWMEALANHVGFSPAWLRPPAVTRSALGCQSSVGSGTRTVGPRKPGFWCEVGEFMPGPELLLIAQWLKLVPSCGYIGIQSSNCIIKKCEPVWSWHWATLCRNARFPLDETGRLLTSRTEIENFRSVLERSWLLAGTVCGTKRRMGIAQVYSSWVNDLCYSAMVQLKSWIT